MSPDNQSNPQNQDALALLETLRLGNREIEAGEVQSVEGVISHIRESRANPVNVRKNLR